MEAGDFLIFLQKAVEKEQDEKLRAEWNCLQPFMVSGFVENMTLNQYKDRRTGKNIDMRPAEEIIADINEAHRKMNGKGGEK